MVTRQKKVRTAKPVPTDVEGIKARFADFPAIEVLSRRFNDPTDPGSLPILLRDEDPNSCVNSDHQFRLKPGATRCHLCHKPARKWYVRYFNLAQEGRNAQMRSKGYVGVEVKELQDADDVADRFGGKDELYVRRGDRGQEILAKQPLEAHNFIKAKAREQREAVARSAKKMRQELAEAAGKELGDEAGSAIDAGEIQVESMKRSRTSLGEEATVGDE